MADDDPGPTNSDMPDGGPNSESVRGNVDDLDTNSSEDVVDGCDLSDTTDDDAVADDDVDGVVLFADIEPGDEEAVAKRMAEYEELFSAS